MKQPKVSVIIPAFNEEERIKSVLRAAKNTKIVSEIIVVNDGSDDKTGQIAEKEGVLVLNLPFNHGKFLAVKKGVLKSKGSLIAVLDADLLEVRSSYLFNLVNQVKNPKTMVIAQFIEGRFSTNHHGLNKYLSGQRAASRSFWLKFFGEIKNQGLSDEKLLKRGFSLENELNGFIKRHDCEKVYVEWPGVSHVMKEEKRGAQGFAQRIKMYFEILINIFSRIFRFFKSTHLHTSDVG
jgi:glycosyltransferase involved in cell wall biosynthesis